MERRAGLKAGCGISCRPEAGRRKPDADPSPFPSRRNFPRVDVFGTQRNLGSSVLGHSPKPSPRVVVSQEST